MAKKKSADYETYIASAKPSARMMGAAAAAAASAFKIEVRFLGGLTTAQKNAFKTAADRWASVIVGDLPSVRVDGEVIDDLLILAQGTAIDGPGRILGQAGPTHIRPASAGKSEFLPVKGIMSFDTADLKDMQTDGHAQGRHHPRDGPRARHRHDLGAQGAAEGRRAEHRALHRQERPARVRQAAEEERPPTCRWRTPAAPAPPTATGARACSATS